MISCQGFCRLEDGELPLKLGEDPTGDTAAFAGTAPLPLAPVYSLPFPSPGPAQLCWQPTLGMAKTPIQGCPASRRSLNGAYILGSHTARDLLQDPSLTRLNS